MTILSRKIIQHPNLITFVSEVVEAALDGWHLDEQNPPGLYGFYYETHMLQDETTVKPLKPSRAEILGNARAAKKALKATQGTEDTSGGGSLQEDDSEPPTAD